MHARSLTEAPEAQRDRKNVFIRELVKNHILWRWQTRERQKSISATISVKRGTCGRSQS
jgi:hypothetical protein